MEFRAVPGALPVRNDGATREGLSTPAIQELVRQARPFAEILEGAQDVDAAGPAAGAGPAAATSPAPGGAAAGIAGTQGIPNAPAGRREPRGAEGLREGLVGAGLGADLAGEIVAGVVAAALPFGNAGRLRTLVRDQLALRLPVAPASAGRRVAAVVGPAGAGKTAAVAGIAIAHAAAGQTVACLAVDPSDGGAALESMLAEADVLVAAVAAKGLGRVCGAAPKASEDLQLAAAVARADLVLIDTPPAWAGAERLTALARGLRAAGAGEVHLALRAGTAAPVGAELASGLAALRPDRLLLTGAGETAHLGGALDVAIRCGLPLGYVAEGPDSIAPADGRDLASRVTP